MLNINKEDIAGIRERLKTIRTAALGFFEKAEERLNSDVIYNGYIWEGLLTPGLRIEGTAIRDDVKTLSIDIAGAARGSRLISEADFHDLRVNTRRMLASVRFREYLYQGLYIHHDEDVVLGVDPPSQGEKILDNVAEAQSLFESAAENISDVIVDLLSPVETGQLTGANTAVFRPNTAFIMMAIDKDKPALEDVKNAIKEVCKEFGVTAITADEIEHEGAITDRVLDEIETSEFLIADLTSERPNVYYEIGHAHARRKRVVLYCKIGTKVHFDIAHRNCPEYKNLSDLKQQLRRRMETLTNKPMKSDG